tara:strand:+ start:101 stop:1057 length:957 start_codon:yes stop_codon:yes gene_type:complete
VKEGNKKLKLEQIWIDWQSPSTHRAFNEALVALAPVKPRILYIFSKDLLNPIVRSKFVNGHQGRFVRAFYIAKLIISHRQADILLLTYDPLFLPILNLIPKKLRVVEHNTTPEIRGQSKHVLWQKIFMRNVSRLTQFPGQGRRLSELNLRNRHLGSPLLENDRWGPRELQTGFFIAPNSRSCLGDLAKIGELFGNQPIQIKGGPQESLNGSQLNLVYVETFDLENYQNIKGIIITISSSIRGSGWFNDAITLGIPLIITDKNAQNVFIETFPTYPYVDPLMTSNSEEFEMSLSRVRKFDHGSYIQAHNELVGRNLDFM